MTTPPREYIKITKNKRVKGARGEVKSVEFQNDGYHIIYLPSLNLSAYGKSQSEAETMLRDVVLPDFVDMLLHCKPHEIYQQLYKLGWEKSKYYNLEVSKTAHIDKEGILRDFELAEDTELKEGLVTV